VTSQLEAGKTSVDKPSFILLGLRLANDISCARQMIDDDLHGNSGVLFSLSPQIETTISYGPSLPLLYINLPMEL
jgi:hypothetical protein